MRHKLPHYNTIDDAVELIKNAEKIIVLTGAGISVSCGIPDFRSENGIYQRLGEYHLPNPQCMFDLEFFHKNPKPFFHFAKELLPGNFVPAPTHFFIGELHARGKLRRNFTQNIDGLEKLAGLDDSVLHQCHGHFETVTCTNPECRHKCLLGDIRPKIEAQQVPICPVCADTNAAAAEGTQGEESKAENVPQPVGAESSSVDMSSKGAGMPGESPITGGLETTLEEEAVEKRPKGVLKPDIVFFGENLGDHFRNLINEDKVTPFEPPSNP